MSHKKKVIAIIGSTSTTSRTKALVEFIVEALHAENSIEVDYLELGVLAAHIGTATTKAQLSAAGLAAIDAIEGADLIVAASPVYKGTYTGLFKHLIDFVHPEALVGTPVLLAATGGSDRHALVVDQQLRPLFSFFRAQTVPSAVYATETDFDAYVVKSEALKARVREAAQQAGRLLRADASEATPRLRAVA